MIYCLTMATKWGGNTLYIQITLTEIELKQAFKKRKYFRNFARKSV